MSFWRSFGASVIGPGHVTANKRNQDAWGAFHNNWGDGIIVSDGLGSKPFSDFGSKAACLAVTCAVRAYLAGTEKLSDTLIEYIKKYWLSFVAPLDPYDCATTCLFAFRTDGGVIRVGMLGDGLAAIVKNDGSIVSLIDDKAESFSNITAALSPRVTVKDWQWLSIADEDCKSIVLCTDGVSDDLADADGFVRAFVDAHCNLSSVSASRRTREMLNDWPTPKHSDDKTIACLYKEEVADE